MPRLALGAGAALLRRAGRGLRNLGAAPKDPVKDALIHEGGGVTAIWRAFCFVGSLGCSFWVPNVLAFMLRAPHGREREGVATLATCGLSAGSGLILIINGDQF